MSKLLTSCSSKPRSHALDGEEYVEKGDDLVRWKMPIVPTDKVYKKKKFSFSSDPSITTIESKFSIGKRSVFVRLFDRTPSSIVKGRSCDKLNVGMVQIGVKTITKKIPSNASIILCLRDNRIHKLPDAIVGMVESSLSKGPFYFNIFPNINLSLYDNALVDVLTLNVLIDGFEEIPAGSEPILLTCRTCYKLNETNFGPEALLESPTGKTIFFQTEIQESSDVVQKVTKWDQVQLPPDWPPQIQRKRPSIIFSTNNVSVK